MQRTRTSRPRRLALAALALLSAAPLLATVEAATASPAAASTGTCHRWAATGGSDAHDGSQARPYRSLAKLVASLAPGQVGCLPGGQVYEAVQGNGIVRGGQGTPAAPVTLTSGGTGRATVVGSLDLDPSSHDVVLTNLSFVGTAAHPDGRPVFPKAVHLNVRGDRIAIRGNDITNPFGICIGAGTMDAYSQAGAGRPADDLVVSGNRIFGCGMSPLLTWSDTDSGAHGIYLVWTRRARISENLIVGNRYRGLQTWPRSDGAVIERNLFDRNATHVNLGSALREGYPWHTTNTTVRDNIMLGRTDHRPEKNQASVVGNFPAGPTYGNVVTGNCIDPARTPFAGNGFIQTGNELALARFTGDAYRLTADSPCRGKGPASVQPTQAAPIAVPARQHVAMGAGRCTGGRLTVDLPAAATSARGGEWVFVRHDVVRWDGARWVVADTSQPWRYGWATGEGLVPVATGTGGTAPWVTHDAARTGATAGTPIIQPVTAGSWYAVRQSVWFAGSEDLVQTWTQLGGGQEFCRP